MTTPWLNAFYSIAPDASIPSQRITFGTSGYRDSSLTASFNELHILAIAQAVVDYRQQAGISGPLFFGFRHARVIAPSGTEALYKVYAESFISEAHVQQLIDEAQDLLSAYTRLWVMTRIVVSNLLSSQ